MVEVFIEDEVLVVGKSVVDLVVFVVLKEVVDVVEVW